MTRVSKTPRRAPFLIVGAALFIVLVTVAIVGCTDQIEDFNNPIDPQNANSPFITPINPTGGAGIFPIYPGQDLVNLSCSWEPIDQATQYQFQLSGTSYFSPESIVEDRTIGGTTVSTVPLSSAQAYYWRVRYEASVDFGSGPERAWGPWYTFRVDFSDGGDQPTGEGYGTFIASGVIRGTPVAVDGTVTFQLPTDPTSEYKVWFDLESTDPASAGKFVGLELNPMGLQVGTYTMPSIGEYGIEMLVMSDLIFESEGYGGNYVDGPSTLTITTAESQRIAGTFNLDTNIDDTLTGSFDFTVPGYEPERFPDNTPYGGPMHNTTITIDGDPSDWADVTSRIIEHTGDSLYSGTGGDISRVSVAADATNLYFMMELADNTPSVTQEFDYRFWIQDMDTSNEIGHIEIGMEYDGSSWSAYGFEEDGTTWQDITSIDNSYGAVGTVIEMKLPRSLVSLAHPWAYRANLQRNTLPEDPDGTDFWLFPF